MVSEHTLIPGKGERGQRVPHTTGGYGAGRQSVPVSDGCRREGYRATHLVSGVLYRLRTVCPQGPNRCDT